MGAEEEEEEEKDRKKEKEQLNTIEGQALNGNRPNPLKKRNLDGTIVVSSDSTKKPKTNTFESAMLNFLVGLMERQKNTSPEDVTKDILLKIYRILERWRVLSKPIPPLTDTPLASSSSASLSFN